MSIAPEINNVPDDAGKYGSGKTHIQIYFKQCLVLVPIYSSFVVLPLSKFIFCDTSSE